MYFWVKAWNTFELSCSDFSITMKTFSVKKKIGKFWFYEDCSELTRILIEFSSFGWTEESIFIEFFTTGLPDDETVWTFSQSNVTSGITMRVPPTRTVAALSCRRQSLMQGELPSIPSSPGGLQAWQDVLLDKRQMSSKRESQTRQRSAPGDVSQGWEERQGGRVAEGKWGGEREPR